jgi:anti-sigma factor RsiW
MNCGRVCNQLSAYIDRELTGVEMLHLQRHLGDCDRCRIEYEALRRTKMLLGRLRAPDPDRDFVVRAVQRWQFQALRRPERPRPVWLTRLSLLPWPRLTLGLTTAALAAALVFTSVSLRRPRHPDPMVDSSRIAALQGRDLESQSVPYLAPLDPPEFRSYWRRTLVTQPRPGWITVSHQVYDW